MSTTATNDPLNEFPTPVEAALKGLNPNPEPIETGLSTQPELVDLVGGFRTPLHARHVHDRQARSDSDYEYHDNSNSRKSYKSRALAKAPEVGGSYEQGVDQGANIVGTVLATAYGVATKVVDKVRQVTEGSR